MMGWVSLKQFYDNVASFKQNHFWSRPTLVNLLSTRSKTEKCRGIITLKQFEAIHVYIGLGFYIQAHCFSKILYVEIVIVSLLINTAKEGTVCVLYQIEKEKGKYYWNVGCE